MDRRSKLAAKYSMRNFIDIISKGLTESLTEAQITPVATEAVLLEGKHFEAMFAGIEGLAKRYDQEHVTAEVATCKELVRRLKRNDRQAWAARILRIWMIEQMAGWSLSTFADADLHWLDGKRAEAQQAEATKAEKFAMFRTEVQRLEAKYKGDYEKAFGVAFDADRASQQVANRDPKSLIKNLILNHWLGMPYSKIQNYTFAKSMNETFADLTALEKEYKDRARGLMTMEEGDQIIIRLPDNYVWVLLSRGYCDKEASAMGHCGNAGAKYGDQIISLRRIKDTIDGVPFMEPCLTFILNSDGKLGEMKGRGNDKPAARYHDQIVELLRNPIVKGIRGGGYMPKNNFSLDDLPDDVKEKLLDTHPHLGGWQARLQKAMKAGGVSEAFLTELVAGVKESNEWTSKAHATEDGNIVVYEWSEGIDEMIEEMSDDEHTKEVAKNEYDFESYDNPSDDRIENFMDSMPVQYQIILGKIVIDQMEASGADEDEIDDFDPTDMGEVLSKLEEYQSDLYDALQTATLTGETYGAESDAHDYLVKAVASFKPKMGKIVYPTYEHEGRTGWTWDSPVKLVLTPEEAAKLADESSDNGDEFEYDDDRDLKSVMFPDEKLEINQPYYGYSGFDEDAAMDRFREEADLGEHEVEGRPAEPDWDAMSIEEVKSWIEAMYEKIPDGYIRKVHPDTLPDDRIRASAKGLYKKYYNG